MSAELVFLLIVFALIVIWDCWSDWVKAKYGPKNGKEGDK
jgi:hypothetical protein